MSSDNQKHNESTNPKLINRLKKLLALAERGVGGEKDNARNMLEKLLKKHGLTESDLAEDTVKEHWFKHNKGRFYDTLLTQIIYAVCGPADRWSRKDLRYQIGVDCTDYDAARIRLLYEAYAKPMDDALDLAYNAFVQVNDIFPKGVTESKTENEEPDLDYLEKLAHAMGSIDRVEVREALPAPNPLK